MRGNLRLYFYLLLLAVVTFGCTTNTTILNSLTGGSNPSPNPGNGTGLDCHTASVLIKSGVGRAAAATKTTLDATPLLPGGNPVPDQCNIGKRVAWTVPGPCHLENDLEGFNPTLALESEGTCGPIVAVVDSIRSNAITVTVTK